MSRLQGPLARPPFRRLTLAWFTTNIADSALYLMLAVWVKDLTDNDAAAALVFVFLGLPAFVAPLAGKLADSMSRRLLMLITNFGVAIAVLALLFVQSGSDVWIIYAITVVYGTAQYLIGASQAGLLRDMLPDEELASANGLFTTIDQGLRILAPLIGTALYVAFGPDAVVILTTACFGTAGVFMLTVRLQESAAQPGTKEFGGMWTGFRMLFANAQLRMVTIAIGVGFGITGLLNIMVFPLIEQGLGLPAAALGPIQTVQGLGAVIGGITAALVIRRLGEYRVVALGLGLLTACTAAATAVVLFMTAGTVAAVGVAGVAWFIGGTGIAWTVVGASTFRIRLIPSHAQGRAASAMNMSINLPQTVVMIVGAGLILSLDFRILLIACAVILLASVVSMRPWRRAVAKDAEPGEVSVQVDETVE